MVCIILLTIYLVLYTTPILAVLSVFVAYEVFRRSANQWNPTPHPTQEKKDTKMKNMNPAPYVSLEEEVVAKMAPIGIGSSIDFKASTYKPVTDKVCGGSMV